MKNPQDIKPNLRAQWSYVWIQEIDMDNEECEQQ